MTLGPQSDVDAQFDSAAQWWRDVYAAPTTEGAVYRRRRDRVLAWIDALGLPTGASVLEVGAGAGIVAVELARRGHRVHAVDSSDEMVALLRERARQNGAGDRLTAASEDAHALGAPAGTFDLVVAIGLLPWLHAPQDALREIVRVARPGAAVIVTSDNRARLNLRLRALLSRGARVLPGESLWRPYDRAELLALLAAAGLRTERIEEVGFGPFATSIVPERAMVRLEAALQRAADRGTPLLRSAGYQHLVLARTDGPR